MGPLLKPDFRPSGWAPGSLALLQPKSQAILPEGAQNPVFFGKTRLRRPFRGHLLLFIR